MDGTENRDQPAFLCLSERRAAPMEKVFATNDSGDTVKEFLVVAASLADGIYPLGGIGPEVVRRVPMRRAFAIVARV